MSAARPYGSFLISSGARYSGVPTRECISSPSSTINRDTPRSPTLMWLSRVRKMLSVFRSRCMMRRPCRYRNAEDISQKYRHTTSSFKYRRSRDRATCRLISAWRSPPGAYSITRCAVPRWMKEAKYFTMCGWCSDRRSFDSTSTRFRSFRPSRRRITSLIA